MWKTVKHVRQLLSLFIFVRFAPLWIPHSLGGDPSPIETAGASGSYSISTEVKLKTGQSHRLTNQSHLKIQFVGIDQADKRSGQFRLLDLKGKVKYSAKASVGAAIPFVPDMNNVILKKLTKEGAIIEVQSVVYVKQGVPPNR